MDLVLSDMSPLPLREQIVRRVRELILRGTLDEHAHLPSIRRLAREQRVSVVTVQRAYEDLERDKMIYARPGKGYFVSPLGEDTRRARASERVRDALRRPLREARGMGLSDPDIHEIVQELLSDGEVKP